LSPRIEYDPGLVEHAVQHAVRADPRLEAALHRETDPLYDAPRSRGRDAAFVNAFGAFFERLGLDTALRRLLSERPAIGESVGACIVGPVLRARHESAELLVRRQAGAIRPGDRTLMLQVLPRTLADPESTARRLRPELVRIADMVDPAFRYKPSQIDGLPARRNLVKDRYRVLWEVYVSARLAREGFDAALNRTRLRAQLARVFSIGDPEDADLALASILDEETLTHDQFFAWANAPEAFQGSRRGPTTSEASTPGANCPLCGFSTFDWFAFEAAQTELVTRIETRHPAWVPANGACRQCAEIYASA
jgi:hypothetical protein